MNPPWDQPDAPFPAAGPRLRTAPVWLALLPTALVAGFLVGGLLVTGGRPARSAAGGGALRAPPSVAGGVPTTPPDDPLPVPTTQVPDLGVPRITWGALPAPDARGGATPRPSGAPSTAAAPPAPVAAGPAATGPVATGPVATGPLATGPAASVGPPACARGRLDGPLFEADTARLTRAAEGVVAELATVLRSLDADVELVGHTDARPTPFPGGNDALSLERARAVRDALIELGLPADRLTAQGRGATDPLSSDTTEGAYAMNRRVEVSARCPA